MQKFNTQYNVSPLISLPLLKKKVSGNIPNINIDTLLEIYNTIDTEQVKTKRKIKNTIDNVIKYNQELVNLYRNTNINSLPRDRAIEILINSKEDKKIIENIIETNKNKQISTKTNEIIKTIADNKIDCQGQELMSKSRFIKSISEFNSEISSNKNIFYNFNKKNNQIIKNIYSLLETSFRSMSSLISKPIYYISPNKIKIQLFFYWHPLKMKYKKSNFFSKFLILNNNKLEYLVVNLSKYLKKPVELELIRLYYPHYDSNILANLIGLIINFIKFRFIQRKLFTTAKIKNPTRMTSRISNTIIPSFLSGIRLDLAGRILTKKLTRRVKTKTIQRGSLARGKANLVTKARFTNKNKRGAFSITVTTGHLIVN
jgi:hypothetical protein